MRGRTAQADPADRTERTEHTGRGDRGDGAGQGGGRRGHRRGAGRPRRRRRRVLGWIAGTLVVLLIGTAGAGYLYYRHLNGNIKKGERSSAETGVTKRKPNAAGQTPLNILLIGSDSRSSAENVKLGGSKDNAGNPPLGDVQLLIHLSADRKSAAFVSIPRDTRVAIPQCTEPETGKVFPATNAIINESLARGGAGCTLATWEKLTGVYIDHWMTIDFAGVVDMADAVGGVDVCVKQNVWDRPTAAVSGGSGLKMKAGTHSVKGKQALQWLRTRHAWGSDQMRARAQHMYLNSMIRKLKDQNVFTDAGRLRNLAETATDSLTVSKEIGTVKKLYDMAMELKSVPTDRVTMATMPNIEDPQDRNHVLPDGADAEQMWQMLRDDVPFDKNGKPEKDDKNGDASPSPTPTPSSSPDRIGVTVVNGTGSDTQAAVPGRAETIAQELADKGYTRAVKDTSPAAAEARTVVRYPSAELKGDAVQVAKSLGIPVSSVRRSTDASGVTVVVGADWRSGTAYPKKAAPSPGSLPENSDAINGSDKDQCMDVYAPYRW
ncbi:LytR family transcriptional regulator [Streptomyces sp. SID5785]|uniref:LCP family glycopolymer transferase n=1 Tax=Streptomyces sp. SID5785 TaxID=2690309 RepID=UPI001361A0BF|nr:LytR family transcriptional regulator [Streptomyces sp. SID5785]